VSSSLAIAPATGAGYTALVRVIAKRTLRAFWNRRGREDSEHPLLAWHKEAEAADWASPADIKRKFRSASILRNGRVAFNIAGNKYRFVVAIRYDSRIVFIRFVGTHAEYDAIDAQEI
jgi:mRNA interferase HigB